MKIKVEPFLMKKGNRVAKAAIEFEEGFLEGFHLVGFTICDDAERGLFVLFPSSTIISNNKDDKNSRRPLFFLRPSKDDQIKNLESMILDVYESMTAFNSPVKK